MSKLIYCLVFVLFSACLISQDRNKFENFLISQNCDGLSNFPEGEEAAKQLQVKYRDLVEKEDCETAFPIWQRLMKYSAAGHIYHFIDGVSIYEYFIQRDAEDEEKVKAHKEQIINLYEQRLACMSPERGDSNIVMEAFAYQLASMAYEDRDKTLEIFNKVIELNGNKTSAYILAYYADFVVFMCGSDALSKAEAEEVYYKLKEIKDANKGKIEYEENWQYVESYFQDLFPVRTFDCAFYIIKLREMYDDNPNDIEQTKVIIEKLERLDCQETDFYKLLKPKTTD